MSVPVVQVHPSHEAKSNDEPVCDCACLYAKELSVAVCMAHNEMFLNVQCGLPAESQ